jgi:NADH dehydrogenase
VGAASAANKARSTLPDLDLGTHYNVAARSRLKSLPQSFVRALATASSSVATADRANVDRDQRLVHLADGGTIGYDRLVVAAGARTADFGTPGVREHGFLLKSISQALALRDHVLERFELADHEERDGLLTFVVVGGGPTGVETAGALAELVDHVIARDQPQLDLDRVRIVLVEMQDRLLPPFHPSSSAATEKALRERGVDIMLRRSVAAVHDGYVEFDDGSTLVNETLVWVAGVEGATVGGQLGATTTRGGRVEVTPTLTLADDAAVHVIGDVAAALDADGDLLPQLAPVALQQGRFVADRLLAEAVGDRSEEPFRYVDKGTMATIGRNDAVAELPFGIRFSGFLAWLSWLGLHLFFLVGFRNRVAVLFSWLWNYLTYDRSARLILGRGHRDEDELPPPDAAA